MIFLEKLAERLVKQGHRTLIFSKSTKMLNILEEYLLKPKVVFSTLLPLLIFLF